MIAAMKGGDTKVSALADYPDLARSAIEILQQHLQRSAEGQGDGTGFAPLEEVLEALQIEDWIAQGGMDHGAFNRFLSDYLKYSVQIHHPHYLAHQVSPPDTPGALANLVNGVLQNPMAIYEMGPGAAAMEYAVINWMLKKIGWMPQPMPSQIADSQNWSGGVLTHGGSLANLTAMLAARARIAPEAWEAGNPSDLAVLVPETSHYSIARAVSIMGLGANAMVKLRCDPYGAVLPEALEEGAQILRATNKRCLAVVANACSTATGRHDPIPAMADFCHKHRFWLHVDACHGASALLTPKYAHYLNGIEGADSVVWDMHKMLRVPVLCAAMLLRDGPNMESTFAQKASYLAFGQDPESYDALPRSVECTKSSMSLKLFLALAMRGEARLGKFVENCYDATRRFFEIIQARPGFSGLCPPESNILCFRYGSSDSLQKQIREALLKERSFHLTSTDVGERHYLRITVINPHSDEQTIHRMLDAIEEVAGRLGPGS